MGPLIIIGTGLSGYNLAREFRKLDTGRKVILITTDDGRNYYKPDLSAGFTKGKTAEELVRDQLEVMEDTLKVEIRIATTVQGVDVRNQVVRLGGDHTLEYDDLVFAIGADTIKLPLQGNGLDRVYSVNDLMDYGKFRRVLQGKKKVLIIGAGLIGCEYSNDLSNGGFSVEVVDPLPQVLPLLLPEPSAKAVQQGLESLGVKFHLGGALVKTVNQSGEGVEVGLSDGQKLFADVVLSAVGLRPRIQLAQGCGLKVNRGIVVNRKLQTSVPNVYALGDCAEVEGQVLLYVLPLMAAAKALAKTLAGEPTDVVYGAMPVSIKTPVCPIVVSPPPKNLEGQWEYEGTAPHLKALFRDRSGKLQGFALTGDATKQRVAVTKEMPPILA